MTTFRTYAAVGIREDLSDTIYSISPTSTPFMSSIGKSKATNTYHEWQTDQLAAPRVNAAIEGADASTTAAVPTVRVGNRTQISEKTIGVTGTLESVDKAGRKSQKAYELAKASSEIKRDMEFALLNNTVSSNGSAGSAARVLGGLQTWLASNTSLGTSGTAGASGTTARVSGTNRTFTEALLQSVVKSVFTNGGTPKILMVTPAHKQVVSSFAGIAAQRYMAPADAPTTIVGAADVYLSDFGSMSVVPNRFMLNGNGGDETAFVLDPEYAAIAYLRPFQTNDLAKVGDSEKTQLLVEYTLEVRSEAAHGIISDLS
jgi:hypothetical protein